jgi:hypothetical protein
LIDESSHSFVGKFMVIMEKITFKPTEEIVVEQSNWSTVYEGTLWRCGRTGYQTTRLPLVLRDSNFEIELEIISSKSNNILELFILL